MPNRLHLKVVLLILAVLLLASCKTTPKEEPQNLKVSSVSSTTNFAWGNSYAFHPQMVHVERDARFTRVHRALHGAIDQQLQGRGLKRVGADKADLLIGYVAGLDERFAARDVDRIFDFQLSEEASTETRAPGTVVIVAIRRDRNRIVWRGAIQTEALLDMPLHKREARINLAVKHLFDRAP